MEFSPDGKVLALADEDSLQLIDIAQGKVRWTASYKDKIHRPEVQWVSTKKPWPEKIVWLHGGDVGIFFQVGELWTWKTSDGTPAKHYTSQATKPLAVAKDAPVLAFTQDGRSLQFLDTSTGKVLQPVEGHRNPPSVLFRSDGSLISYDERKICLWTGGDWRLRTSFEFHDKGQRYYVGPSQNFFVRTVGTKVETRNLESGKVIKEWTLKSSSGFRFPLAGREDSGSRLSLPVLPVRRTAIQSPRTIVRPTPGCFLRRAEGNCPPLSALGNQSVSDESVARSQASRLS